MVTPQNEEREKKNYKVRGKQIIQAMFRKEGIYLCMD